MGKNIINDIIYNFDELKIILSDKLQDGVQYLLIDDFFFEKLNKKAIINREIYTLARRILEPLDILKYVTFTTECGTKEIYHLIQELNKSIKVIVAILNEEEKECTLIFVEINKDSFIEQQINNFIEQED